MMRGSDDSDQKPPNDGFEKLMTSVIEKKGQKETQYIYNTFEGNLRLDILGFKRVIAKIDFELKVLALGGKLEDRDQEFLKNMRAYCAKNIETYEKVLADTLKGHQKLNKMIDDDTP